MNLVSEPKLYTFHPDLETLNFFNVIPYGQEKINKPKLKLKDEVLATVINKFANNQYSNVVQVVNDGSIIFHKV